MIILAIGIAGLIIGTVLARRWQTANARRRWSSRPPS